MGPRLTLILLAAGAGSRVGTNKAVMHLGGRPVLERLAAEVMNSGFTEVIVVSGAQHEEVEALARRLDIVCVHNERWPEGQSSSVAQGVSHALRSNPDGCALLPVDHVFTRREDLRALASAFSQNAEARERIFRPTCDGALGHPVLFGAAFLPEFLELEGAPANRVYRSNRPSVILVPVDNARTGEDVDTEEDRVRAERILSAGSD